jgi:putative DNA primase/helicase
VSEPENESPEERRRRIERERKRRFREERDGQRVGTRDDPLAGTASERDDSRAGTSSGEAEDNVVDGEFWRLGLLCSKEGMPKRCLANVMHVLSLHPQWAEVVAWDAFGLSVVTRARPPMRHQDRPKNYELGDWTDEDSARTVAWFASEVGFEPAVVHVDQAVGAIAHRTIVHPVRDWLASLEWDGTQRIGGFASRYLGATESLYSAAVGRRWLISAVARVFEPGCKVDSLLGLEGEQGIGKSSALRILASQEWFADTGITLGDKDSYQALRRKWIYEFAELASIRGREIERVKSFLSSPVDTFRASYGRRTQDHPRQVVFAGSTNEDTWLSDPTGARRFWPIRCGAAGPVDLEALKRDREQLWAEARVAYEAGEPWYLETAELRADATEEQAARAERDDWIDIVARWLTRPTRPDGHGGREVVDMTQGITTSDALLGALSFAPERVNAAATKRVGHVLRALTLEPRRPRGVGGTRERRYFRASDPTWTTGSTWTASAAELGSGPSGPSGSGSFYVHESSSGSPVVGERVMLGKPGGPAGPPGPDDDVERSAIQGELYQDD